MCLDPQNHRRYPLNEVEANCAHSRFPLYCKWIHLRSVFSNMYISGNGNEHSSVFHPPLKESKRYAFIYQPHYFLQSSGTVRERAVEMYSNTGI